LIQDFKVAALYPYLGFNHIVRKINEKALPLFLMPVRLPAAVGGSFLDGNIMTYRTQWLSLSLCSVHAAVPVAEALGKCCGNLTGGPWD